jgi:hypothetical protein
MYLGYEIWAVRWADGASRACPSPLRIPISNRATAKPEILEFSINQNKVVVCPLTDEILLNFQQSHVDFESSIAGGNIV